MTRETTGASRSRYGFAPELRLRKAVDFKAVYETRKRRREGPLLIWIRRNDLAFPRLGLAIGRRAGNAVMRHAIKRRLREAFRLLQHDWPEGYDVVISTQRHDLMKTQEYEALLKRVIDRVRSKRQNVKKSKRQN